MVTVYTERLQRAIEERPLLPQAWRAFPQPGQLGGAE